MCTSQKQINDANISVFIPAGRFNNKFTKVFVDRNSNLQRKSLGKQAIFRRNPDSRNQFSVTIGAFTNL